MDLNIECELTMARALTRGKRKLSVSPLRCRDRRLVHRPSGADSLDGAISEAVRRYLHDASQTDAERNEVVLRRMDDWAAEIEASQSAADDQHP